MGQARLIVKFLEHTHTHTHARTHAQTKTHGRTRLNECSANLRYSYLHNTQQTQETNIHILRGIRTLDPSNLAAEDIRLRPSGHRDRHSTGIVNKNNT